MSETKKLMLIFLQTKIILDIISKIILTLPLRVSLPILQLSISRQQPEVLNLAPGTSHFLQLGLILPSNAAACVLAGFEQDLGTGRLCLCTSYPTPLNLGSLAEGSCALVWIPRNNLMVQHTGRQGTHPSCYAF